MSKKRASISIWEKQEAIEWIATTGQGVPSRAAKHFHSKGWTVDAATFRKWWRNRDEILLTAPYQKRVKGGGRKPILGELEDVLLDAIIERRLRKEKVTRSWIANEGRRLFVSEVLVEEEPDLIQFGASHNWVSKFMTRNDLSLRRRTNLTILSDEQLVSRAVSYMRFLTEHKTSYNLDHTILMDETAVYFEDARDTTIDVTGARHVVVKSTGFSSMRITAVMAVTASGRKLPPLLIWKDKKGARSVVKHSKVYVSYQPKGWVDSQLLMNWIDKMYPSVMHTPGKTIVWDSMRAHISKAVKSKCDERGIQMCVIPDGLTPYLQAGDIGIFKFFKDQLYQLIDEWKNSSAVQYTKGGNPRPPSVELASSWVASAWKNTPALVVQNYIDGTGFHTDPRQWFISNHDVYGWRFQQEWFRDEEETKDSEIAQESDDFVDDELSFALDDVDIIDDE